MAVKPGQPVGIREFRIPEGWDGTTPISERDLRFLTEAALYAEPQEVSAEYRERVRRGWAC
jgi:hypothetical protein